MDNSEFYELTEQTVRAFLPRVPEKYRNGFDSTLAAGEYRMALEDLVYTVVDDSVPVTAAERDTFYKLARHLPRNGELLEDLESLTVQTAAN